jgi:hypothetical protein
MWSIYNSKNAIMKEATLKFLVLSVCFFITLSVFCDTFGDYEYTDNGSDITITDYTGSDAAITIPADIIGKPVVEIVNYAFSNCTSLTSILIPDTVTSIGNVVFGGCTSLTAITVDPSNPNYSSVDGVLFNKTQTELIRYPEGKAGTGYVILGSVTAVRTYAFSYCLNLTSVTIPTSVTEIDNDAFYASGITSVSIPASVTTIGDRVFRDCGGLTVINIDPSNPNYSSVDGIFFNKAQTELIKYPNAKTGTSYAIPGSVTALAQDAFAGCSNLTSITIPDSVTIIWDLAFSGCANLASFTVDPANTEFSSIDGVLLRHSFGSELFHYPEGKPGTSYTVPLSVTRIRKYAFRGNPTLTSIILHDGITSVGTSAFAGCSALSSIDIPASVHDLSFTPFSGCTNLTAINVDPGNSNYSSIDGVLFDDTQTILIEYPDSKTDTSYAIPSSVTSVIWYSFTSANFLTSVVIPSSVDSVGSNAFQGCSNLAFALFEGNAPSTFETNAFNGAAPGFSIYYLNGATGFTTPTWNGYPCSELPATHSADTNYDWSISQTEVNSFIAAYNSNDNTVSGDAGSITAGRITMREVMRVIFLHNDGGAYEGGQATVDTYDVVAQGGDPAPTTPETPLPEMNTEDVEITVSSSADSGAGSLRDAIAIAADGETIRIDDSLDTITLLSEIVIDKSITIDGQGVAIVSGGSQTRIFRVQNDERAIDVTLRNMGIVDAVNSSDEFGGAIYNNGQTLTLDTVLFDGNANTYENGKGGAVYSSGTLTVDNCVFQNNTAVEENDIYSDNGDVN